MASSPKSFKQWCISAELNHCPLCPTISHMGFCSSQPNSSNLGFVGFVLFLSFTKWVDIPLSTFCMLPHLLVLVPKQCCLREYQSLSSFSFYSKLSFLMPTRAFTNTLHRSEPIGRSPWDSRLENKSFADNKTPSWSQKSCFLLKIKSVTGSAFTVSLLFFLKEAILPQEISSALQAPNGQCLLGFRHALTCPHISAQARP